jgi:hypothetical protein
VDEAANASIRFAEVLETSSDPTLVCVPANAIPNPIAYVTWRHKVICLAVTIVLGFELKKNLKSNIMETQTTLRQAGARGGRQDLYRDLQDWYCLLLRQLTEAHYHTLSYCQAEAWDLWIMDMWATAQSVRKLVPSLDAQDAGAAEQQRICVAAESVASSFLTS